MITSHIVYWAAAGVLLFLTALYLCIGHLLAYMTRHDAEAQQWQKENPRIKKNKVPVVEYLVHWAGWASEDDTWERAQDNLADEVVEGFHENRDNKCPTIFPHVKP